MMEWDTAAEVEAVRLSALALTAQLATFDHAIREKLAKLDAKLTKAERAVTYVEASRSLQHHEVATATK